MINAENVTFAYPARQPGDAPLPILRDLSLLIEEGMAMAVMGPAWRRAIPGAPPAAQ